MTTNISAASRTTTNVTAGPMRKIGDVVSLITLPLRSNLLMS